MKPRFPFPFGLVCSGLLALVLAPPSTAQFVASAVGGELSIDRALVSGPIGTPALAPNQAPVVHLLEPSPGASYPFGSPVPIRLEVVDPDGYVPHVEYFVDGQKIDEITLNFFVAPPPGQSQAFASKWSKPTAGAHKLAVVVVDDSGTKVEAGVSFSVAAIGTENQRPHLTLLEPKEESHYAVGDTVALVVQTVDPDGYVTHIEFYVDGNKIGEETISFLVKPPPGQAQEFKWPWPNATAGTHKVRVVVVDDRNAEAEANVQFLVGPAAGPPSVSIEATRPETIEPCPVCRVAPGEFTLSRTGDPKTSLVVTVNYSGSATPGMDYGKLPARMEFPAGQSTVALHVGALEDQLVEGDETVIATLIEEPAGGVPTYFVDPNRRSAKVIIHDRVSDSLPIVSVVATRPETREPFLCKTEPCPLLPEAAPAVFTFSRKGGDWTQALSIPVAFDGEAVNGVDYARLSSVVVIPAGAGAVDVDVTALPDDLVESDESVLVHILLPQNDSNLLLPYQVDRGSAQVVIHDFTRTSVPIVSIAATQPVTAEPCPTCLVLPGVFTVTRTGSTANALHVLISYSGTAIPGVDYNKLANDVEIPAGRASVELLVLARLDNLPEGEESVVATLEPDPSDGPVPQYVVNSDQATAKVVIHDAPDAGLVPVVGVSVSRKECTECPPDAACDMVPVEIIFKRSSARLDQALTLPIAWDGTAAWPEDFSISLARELPKTVLFGEGIDVVKLLLFANSDCVIEGTESVRVKILPDLSLGPIERYRIAEGQGAVEIAILDGSKPKSDAIAIVGINGGGSAPEFCPRGVNCLVINFVLTRSGGNLDRPLAVQLEYGGTATPDVDYPALPRVVTFAAGESATSLIVRPKDDVLVEGEETIVASLTCSDSTLATYRIDGRAASATGVIIDNEHSTAKAFVTVTVPKDGAEFTDPDGIDFEARTGDPLGAMTHLDWYADGGKIGESSIEFIRAPDPGTELTLSFTWKTPPIGEHEIYATGRDAVGKRVTSPTIRVRVVHSQSLPALTVEAGRSETREVPPGSKMALFPAFFVVRRTGALGHPLKFYYAVGGSAVNGRDYQFLDGDASFAAGESERVIYVSPITDELVEGDETVELKLLPRDAYVVAQPAAASVIIHDAQQPAEPVVKFLEPTEGAEFEAGSDLKLVVNTIDPSGYFGWVEFYANDHLVGSDGLVLCLSLACQPSPGTPFQFSAVWKNVPGGKYSLVAVARNAADLRVKSSPINITVGPKELEPFVSRILPRTYQPGVPVNVILQANPPATANGYALEDHPPKGWVVGSISEGGAWDSLHGAVKFGPFLDHQARSMHYALTPPIEARGVAEFSGVASLDGISQRISGGAAVFPQPDRHPADRDPSDWSLSLNEVTAYGAAWKRGDSWPVDPNPIPIDYVTRAGALWRGGETYLQNLAAGPAPLCWINATDQSVPPAELNFDLPPTAMAANLEILRARRSFAFAEVAKAPSGGLEFRVVTLPGENVRSHAVEVSLPTGAQVGNISDGGVLDHVRGLVRWGPFADATVRTLKIPIVGEPGIEFGFGGRASFDGESVQLGVARAPVEGSVARGPRIAGLRRLLDGSVQMLVVSDTAGGCDLEYTDDVVTWHRIGEMAAGATCQVYQDTDANESPTRFYRAVLRP